MTDSLCFKIKCAGKKIGLQEGSGLKNSQDRKIEEQNKEIHLVKKRKIETRLLRILSFNQQILCVGKMAEA